MGTEWPRELGGGRAAAHHGEVDTAKQRDGKRPVGDHHGRVKTNCCAACPEPCPRVCAP
jgi:hypothetical protein